MSRTDREKVDRIYQLEGLSHEEYPSEREQFIKLLQAERRAMINIVKKATRYRQGTMIMVTEPDGWWIDRETLLKAMGARGRK